MAFNQGIMVTGFEQIFDDQKRTVTLYSATRRESAITGTEELSYDDGTSVELVFFKTGESFEWAREGLMEYGDFVIFDKPDNLNMKKDDKVTIGGETFIIQNILTWKSRGVSIYDIGTGILLS